MTNYYIDEKTGIEYEVAVELSDVLLAAEKFVEEMAPKADYYMASCPMWYGWVIRVAFEAGAKYEANKKEQST